jgi:hypothetical protein
MNFPNSCAIRMSEALVATDRLFLGGFARAPGNRCPHGYMRGAQDLGAFLASTHGFGRRDIGWVAQAGGTPPAAASTVQGIICYMNIPGFGGTGHIDLWSNGQPQGEAYWNAETIWCWRLQ